MSSEKQARAVEKQTGCLLQVPHLPAGAISVTADAPLSLAHLSHGFLR